MAKALKSAAKPNGVASKKQVVKAPPKKVAATPKGITQKQYDDLKKQLEESEAKRITAEEIMHQNSGEDQTAIKALEAENKRLKSEITTQKVQKASLKDELDKAKQKIGELAGNVENAYQDTKGWLDRGNKWAFAAVPVIILGIWIAVVSIRNNDLHKTITTKDAAINSLQSDLQSCRQGANYDSIHAANNAIPTPQIEGEKKNSSSSRTK